MNASKFLIKDFLQLYEGTVEDLCKKLYEYGIQTKDYESDGLILLYNKFDQLITNELSQECRSLVINRDTYDIVSYSCENPIIKNDYYFEELKSMPDKVNINVCYEGTFLSIFCHNDKWYSSTRRCLDSNNSVFNSDHMSHYEMFNEIIKNAGYDDFNSFTQQFDKSKSYYFIIVHHKNKHVIDYTQKFGTNYGRLCLTAIRDENMNEINIYDTNIDFASLDATKVIFIPEKIEYDNNMVYNLNDNTLLYNLNDLNNNEFEGIVVKIWNNNMNKFNLIKIQSIKYQYNTILGNENNTFRGLLFLYQRDALNYYTEVNNTHTIQVSQHKALDIVKLVDAVFKVCTSELFELFKILWSLKTGKQQNTKLYEFLPKEYRNILYIIRGVYYKKKASLLKDGSQYLKLNDIYKCLKNYPTKSLIELLNLRKQMNINYDIHPELINFKWISNYCDPYHMKLCDIFTDKLFFH
jgi:hypothetical protein